MAIKKLNLALATVAALFAGTAAAAPITFQNWWSNPVSSGDKLFTLVNYTNNGGWNTQNASADFLNSGSLYTVNLSNLQGVTANNTFVYRIDITGTSGNVFNQFRVSENDVLGNTGAGTTTRIYSDASLTNQIFSQSLLQTQVGSVHSFASDLTSIWISTSTTGVSSADRLANMTYNITQRTSTQPGVPEIDAVTGTGALTLMVGAVALVGERRRRRG
jgi:hypothetical protein